jgi:hypothetical protein
LDDIWPKAGNAAEPSSRSVRRRLFTVADTEQRVPPRQAEFYGPDRLIFLPHEA